MDIVEDEEGFLFLHLVSYCFVVYNEHMLLLEIVLLKKVNTRKLSSVGKESPNFWDLDFILCVCLPSDSLATESSCPYLCQRAFSHGEMQQDAHLLLETSPLQSP